MDLASIIGLVMAMVLMVMGIVTGDAGFSAAKGFLDYKSVLSTRFSFMAVMIGCRYSCPDGTYSNRMRSFML